MAFTDEDKEGMDQAAIEAGKDLANLSDKAVKEVANWWKKWYMKAGHKRLARVLLQVTKGEKENGSSRNCINQE